MTSPVKSKAPLDVVGVGRIRPPGQGPPPPGAVDQGVPPAPVIFPPEYLPIPGARLFYTQGSASVSNVASVILTSLVTNPAEIGVIRTVELGINNMVTTTLATWLVRFNQQPIAYGPLTLTPRAAAYVGEARDVVIRVPLGVSVIDVLAVVGAADAGTYLMGASLDGWFWTAAQERLYRQTGGWQG